MGRVGGFFRLLHGENMRRTCCVQKLVFVRAVARSENPGGHIVLGGDNVPPLVEIGLTDLTWLFVLRY